MFSPGFCKDVAKLPDWGCNANKIGHFGKESCSFKKKKQPKYTSAPRFHPNKGYTHKKEKVSRKNPILRKDTNLQIKKNVLFVVKRVTGITNAQIRRKVQGLLLCSPKNYIQLGGI